MQIASGCSDREHCFLMIMTSCLAGYCKASWSPSPSSLVSQPGSNGNRHGYKHSSLYVSSQAEPARNCILPPSKPSMMRSTGSTSIFGAMFFGMMFFASATSCPPARPRHASDVGRNGCRVRGAGQRHDRRPTVTPLRARGRRHPPTPAGPSIAEQAFAPAAHPALGPPCR
jgi:hypothetical protein